MTVAEIKDKYRMELQAFGESMTGNQKMQVALNLEISFLTVQRYQSGKEEEVRNVELAEKILDECKKVTQKATA